MKNSLVKKPLAWFVFSLVVITVLIAINRWDVPVAIWLGVVFGIVALVSVCVFFAEM